MAPLAVVKRLGELPAMRNVALLVIAVGMLLGAAACQGARDEPQQTATEDVLAATPSPAVTATPDATLEAEIDVFDELFDLDMRLCLNLGRRLVEEDLVQLVSSNPNVAVLVQAFLENCP